MTWLFFCRLSATRFSVNICVFLQKSHGNGPLNRLLMAAKRKYMDTELPPQESEGKEVEVGPLVSLHDACLHHEPQEGTSSLRLQFDSCSIWTCGLTVLCFSLFLFRPLPGFKPTPRDMAHRRWAAVYFPFSFSSWGFLERLVNTENLKIYNKYITFYSAFKGKVCPKNNLSSVFVSSTSLLMDSQESTKHFLELHSEIVLQRSPKQPKWMGTCFKM